MTDSAVAPTLPDTPVAVPPKRIFMRLVRMLRPYLGTIMMGLVLLVLASPCELFPAIVWKFVTDDIVLDIRSSSLLRAWFGFGGHIQDRFWLLILTTGCSAA